MRETSPLLFDPENERNAPIVRIPDVYAVTPELNAHLVAISASARPGVLMLNRNMPGVENVSVSLLNNGTFGSKYQHHQQGDYAFQPEEGFFGMYQPHPHPFEAEKHTSRVHGMCPPEQLDPELLRYLGQALEVNLEKIKLGKAGTLDAHFALFPVDGQFLYTYGLMRFEARKKLPLQEQWRRKYDGQVFVTEDMYFLPINPLDHGYLHWREYYEQLVHLPDKNDEMYGEIVTRTGYEIETIVSDTKPLKRKEFGRMLEIVGNTLAAAFSR
jgi:hypothetical protein